ncbi:hypothetical protein Q5741_00940 [Paenibacillus sp. JX-17]|uniref:Uncharacterized protein n=1 Tax=Paenibacillus lacisoli TaxID=3064525 RepID=A0ABT9C7W1_9BACL|nr:hypothetical protein [Paenibacillus sp. JX-17]MDO7904975.1 hypothetical protein [Paenibacillus sp. JX-17]
MAIPAGTCVGVLYYRLVKGVWTFGVHNGSTRNTVTSQSVLILGHVSNEEQFKKKRPEALLFYKTLQEYQAALKKPPKPSVGSVFGVRVATREILPNSKHPCVAFLQTVGKKNKSGTGIVTETIAHNGKFLQYTSPRGKVYNNVAPAIQSISDDPGGTLLYAHYNLASKGSGRYNLVSETITKSGITALRFLH